MDNLCSSINFFKIQKDNCFNILLILLTLFLLMFNKRYFINILPIDDKYAIVICVNTVRLNVSAHCHIFYTFHFSNL